MTSIYGNGNPEPMSANVSPSSMRVLESLPSGDNFGSANNQNSLGANTLQSGTPAPAQSAYSSAAAGIMQALASLSPQEQQEVEAALDQLMQNARGQNAAATPGGSAAPNTAASPTVTNSPGSVAAPVSTCATPGDGTEEDPGSGGNAATGPTGVFAAASTPPPSVAAGGASSAYSFMSPGLGAPNPQGNPKAGGAAAGVTPASPQTEAQQQTAYLQAQAKQNQQQNQGNNVAGSEKESTYFGGPAGSAAANSPSLAANGG